jgi:broad specificity phosphatase PhoE
MYHGGVDKKTLVLIRHAHRDNSLRQRDNGLSDKWKDQARWLKKYFQMRFEKPEGVWLVSSPKKRCLETLAPIATAANLEIDVNPDLDEQASAESVAKFEGRIQHFLKEWQLMPQPLTLVCGHGDWLPLAALQLLGSHCDFKKGGWMELEWDGSALLKSYIPSFKAFYE